MPLEVEVESSQWKHPKRVVVDHNSLDSSLPHNVVMAVKATTVAAENV
jgi:hypothetical protein